MSFQLSERRNEEGRERKRQKTSNRTPSKPPGDSLQTPETNVSGGAAFKIPATPSEQQKTLSFEDSPDSRNSSLSKTPGTPLPYRGDVTCLPDADKFRNNVEEHIPFENLPDAVGTYEKMRKILTDVRANKKRKLSK